MTAEAKHDAWGAGANYEQYMGRWSRLAARLFLNWLEPEPGLSFLDVGCGTGALTGTILQRCSPRAVVGIDPSGGFLSHARLGLPASRNALVRANAAALPCRDGSAAAVVSGLAYNFIPDRKQALSEMQRVVMPGGLVAIYVWDYPGVGVGFMNAFWEAAISLDAEAQRHNQSLRFHFCTPESLAAEFSDGGLAEVEVSPIEITTVFRDFEDFWRPFTLGAGPAPGYCVALEQEQREALRRRLEVRFGTESEIHLPARAWAVRGRRL
jgi:ubiquinone/menaquinone biosynthesis C-methylase UbiE